MTRVSIATTTNRSPIPGVALSIVAASAGVGVHALIPTLSPYVVSISLGVFAANFGLMGHNYAAGLRYAAKRLLRAGIVLVGFRLSFVEVSELGPKVLVTVIAIVAATFFGTRWLGRVLGNTTSLSLLVAVGFAASTSRFTLRTVEPNVRAVTHRTSTASGTSSSPPFTE